MRAVPRPEMGGASSNHSFSVGLGAGRAAIWRQTMPPGWAGSGTQAAAQ
jgi:hypothetical protein